MLVQAGVEPNADILEIFPEEGRAAVDLNEPKTAESVAAATAGGTYESLNCETNPETLSCKKYDRAYKEYLEQSVAESPEAPQDIPPGSGTLLSDEQEITAFCNEKNGKGELVNGKSAACFSWLGIVGESALWAVGTAAAIQALGPIFGLSGEQTDIVSKASAFGLLAGKISADFAAKSVAESGITKTTTSEFAKWFVEDQAGLTGAQWLGVSAFVAYFAINYRDEESKKVDFSCIPWQAPLGGNNCETCNKGFLPCSEYQCTPFGVWERST